METLVADRESSQDRSTAIRVALEGKLDVIMRELQNTEGECSKARAQLEEAERAQQSVAEKHALDLQRQEEAIESLRGALEAAQSTSRDLDKELQQSKAQKDDVVRQHEASSRALQQSSQNSSERLEARITSQTTSLEKYQQTIDDLHQSQKAATKVAQDHQRGLEAALEEAKKDLQHSRSQYESSEAERTKQTQSSKDQLEKMRLRTEEIEKTRADLQRRLDETERGKQATNRDLNNLRESTDKTINRLTSELNATKDLLARERETREEFSVEHKADSQEWQHQLQEVREELKASKASLARETGVTERLKTDMHKLETHFKSTTEDRDRLHTLALERKQTIDRQTGELAQQATKIQSLHSEVEHHSKGIEEHQQRVHDLETQATSRSEQLQRLEVREKQLADSATAWETKHAETSAELTRARSHLEENASEIEKLRSAVDSAKEDTATARVASQRDTISLARERMRRQQVARDGHAAVQLVQDKIGEQSNFVDQLTTQASITRQLQHTLDQRSLELDASRQQTSKLQTQLSLSVQKSSRLKASRDACLRTTQFLLKSLRDHAERTSRLYAHRRSSQNQSSEVQLQIRSFTDQFRKDIQVLRGVAVKSQNMWKQKHIELLETRTQFAEVKAQMGQLRTSEAAASMMLAQERSKRKKALDNAALLSDRFKLLNKSVGFFLPASRYCVVLFWLTSD